MIFGDAVDDFGIVVGGSVRALLAGERDNHSGVVVAGGGQMVGLLPGPHFEPRPLAP